MCVCVCVGMDANCPSYPKNPVILKYTYKFGVQFDAPQAILICHTNCVIFMTFNSLENQNNGISWP